MNKGMSIVGGAGLGAGLMYFFDPDRGRRRRALIRDQAAHWSRKTREAAGTTARDVRNRSLGLTAAVSSWMTQRKPITDQVLKERVRSTLGMVMRHPASIEVEARNGVVTVSGPVLTDEVADILSAVRRVQGVADVRNRLQTHDEPGRIPDLQGRAGRQAGGARFELLQSNWSPTARMITAVVGSAALLYGLRKQTVAATAMAATGLGLLLRSATNRDFARLFDVGETERGRRAGRSAAGEDGKERSARERIKDVMTGDVEVLRPGDPLETAAEKMKRLNVGAIPVCDGERLVGMVTDRDIVVRVVADQRDPKTASVQDAMTTGVIYCFEDEDVQRASELMAEQQIRRVPVLNRDRRLVGMVSLGDLAVRAKRIAREALQQVSEPAEPRR